MDDFAYKHITDTFFGKSKSAKKSRVKKKKRKKRNFLIFFICFGIILSAFTILGLCAKDYSDRYCIKPEKTVVSENVLRGGKINYSMISKVYFEGDAKEQSDFLDFSAKLVNYGNSGHAALIIIFKKPIDLSQKFLTFSAKSIDGKKKLELSLGGIGFNAHKIADTWVGERWESKYIDLNKIKFVITNNIKKIKFDFGTIDTGNTQNSTIYIKDVAFLEK